MLNDCTFLAYNPREHLIFAMSINTQEAQKTFVGTILFLITQFREPFKICELPKRLAIQGFRSRV